MKKLDQVVYFGDNESYTDVKLDKVYFPSDNTDHSKLSGEVKVYNINDLGSDYEV